MAAAYHLVTLVLLYGAVHTSAEMWHQVQVSNATLEGMSPRGERMARSVSQCVMMANRDPQEQLLCFRTPGVCTMYDVRVVAGLDASSSRGHVTPCWIRQRECDKEGEYRVEDNCSISECQIGAWRPYQGVWAANVSFSDLMDKHCIYLETIPKNWYVARESCKRGGGDLFVAGDLIGMLQYLSENVAHRAIVGGKGRTWLDGRPVAPGEWSPGEPSGEEEGVEYCVYYSKTSVQLDDFHCNHTDSQWDAPSLCQIGVSYP